MPLTSSSSKFSLVRRSMVTVTAEYGFFYFLSVNRNEGFPPKPMLEDDIE